MYKFCTFLFLPQMGRQRRRRAEQERVTAQLKRDITYLIGKERAEGNLQPLTPDFISRTLQVPLPQVEAILHEMDI